MVKSASDLEMFDLSHWFAMEIFQISRYSPKKEKYSLTNQVVRASRSITVNIAEGWDKRMYENEFKKHLILVQVHWKNQKHGYCLADTF
jgi:four helix bundle protein